MLNNLTDPALIQLDFFDQINGSLCVYEKFDNLHFQIKRVFTVKADKSIVRGHHAHKRCAQILVCLRGSIRVCCDDGQNKSIYNLDRMDRALVIPPLIWASQTYEEDDSILMVLCDHYYEENDYIRNHDQFLTYKQNK